MKDTKIVKSKKKPSKAKAKKPYVKKVVLGIETPIEEPISIPKSARILRIESGEKK